MKRIIYAAIAVAVMAAGPLALRAAAEACGNDEGKRGEHAEKMMKERLGLSDDQAAKLKASWESGKTAMKTLREQSKEAERKLEEEVRGLASDKEIQATLDRLDADRKAMEAEHQKQESSVAAILKPYQRAKMRLMMMEDMKDHGRWGHGERAEHGDHRHGPKGDEEHHHDDD